jgi:hypothetical protein
MYYGTVRKLYRLKKTLEKIAYISVGADMLIAGSTYLVIKNVSFSEPLLMLSDYLDFALVAVIAVLFSITLVLKYSGEIDKRFRLFVFKKTH